MEGYCSTGQSPQRAVESVEEEEEEEEEALISQICFGNEILHVSDSSSVHHQELFTVHSAMVYVIQVCRQLSSSIRMEIEKLVHLVGFIMRKFVTMHGHMKVKKIMRYVFCRMFIAYQYN
jgi:hypothetical protein